MRSRDRMNLDPQCGQALPWQPMLNGRPDSLFVPPGIALIGSLDQLLDLHSTTCASSRANRLCSGLGCAISFGLWVGTHTVKQAARMTAQQHKTQNKSGQIHEIATLIQIALRSKVAAWIRSGGYVRNSSRQLALR